MRADGTILLSDFGIAKVLEQSTFVSLQTQVGTPAYMSPEQSRGKPCPASDQYALAIIAYEWLTGRLPFQGAPLEVMLQHRVDVPPSLQALCSDVPTQVEQVVLQALAKTPEERFSSVQQFAQAFHTTLQKSSSTVQTPQQCTQPPVVPPAVVPSSPSAPALPSNVPPIPNDQVAHPVLSDISPTQTVGPDRVALPELRSGLPHPPEIPSVPLGELQTPLPPQPARSVETEATPDRQREELSVQPPSLGSLPIARSIDVYPAGSPNYPVPAYAPYPLQQNRKRHTPTRTRATILTIITVVALLVVLIPTVYAVIHPHSQSSDSAHILATSQAMRNLTATAQSAGNVMATQQAQSGTATAHARATGTAQANASAIQTATAGQPIYSDAFDKPDDPRQRAGWSITDNACSFLSDGYHAMTMADPQGCYQSAQQFQNFAAKVDMELASGHSGGLFFRPKTLKTASGYLFEVDSNGQYRLLSSAGSAALQNWTASSALHKGFHVKNTLEVIAQGSDLKLYANGMFLADLQDAAFPDAGYLGFLASVDAQNPSADVVYTNLSVYQA